MTTLDDATGAPGTAAPQPAPQVRKRLGDVLVEKGLLVPEDLEVALAEQRTVEGPRRRLGQILVDLGMVSEAELAQCLAELLNLEHVDLSRINLAPDVVRILPRAVAERCRVLVLDKTPEYLLVAAADPTNVLALDDVKLYTRTPELHVVVAMDSQIRDHLARAWSLTEDTSQVSRMVEDATDDDDEDPLAALNGSVDDDAPIVKLVNRILSDAVRLRCSDIHLESQRDQLRVRFRVDGLLRDVMSAPKRVAPSVISRIKIISGLDISERRIPQDGRTRVMVDGAAIDCRVSTLPALHGEKIVIRLLTRGDDVPSLESLGFEPEQLDIFNKALSVPQGLVLITGPTGSGKTNTLYAAIHATMSPEKNIITLEDPVEVQLPGITQVQVHAKVGMTFSAGLRSVLRQDPDIVLIGEVRDTETAELALKASMTGHLVLSTLHTNSAVGALTRLVDMGAAPFLVASSLTAAIAQRLVRKPCDSCADGYIPDEDTLALLDLTIEDILDATPLKGTGCPECGGSGYRGRTAVYEVLDVTPSVRKVLMHDATEAALLEEAQRIGMKSLRESALAKAMRGETTFEEVIRVTAG
ncbi:GspE/PulE family protein [Kineococcus rhizosphaerae]|uniref:Type IV pilus assembly protein PilB n=1 Tax=Kineococcus rhizosphaerae TaxID=559628 RepID=A0A2T0R449_9ACTN|nr:ATPase, T2SS/T4P/T4SS family [Kineococcus rhizosphaerae]PRY15146.1 type IV pilus assembly protein PilB [Kineococcus rhizosphaerae]